MDDSTIIFTTACQLPCRTCSNTNTSSCLTCYSNPSISNFPYIHQNTSTCNNICPQNTYFNTTTLICLDCSSTCNSCVNIPTNCTTCATNSTYPNFFFNISSDNGNCFNQCPIGYYSNTSTIPTLFICALCIDPCITCVSDSQCVTCADSYYYYYYNLSCLKSCPSDNKTIQNEITKICDPCAPQCATCT
jgi:proprotein convertase subtilisin/kexin type 5